MTDPFHRKQIEDTLQSSICKAQAAVQSNPQVKKMVEQLRAMYHQDQENVMFAMGTGSLPPPTPIPPKPKVPPSRIPQLLLILNTVTGGGSVTLPPSVRNRTGILPVSLKETSLEVVSPAMDTSTRRQSPNSLPSPQTASFSMNPTLIHREIEKLEAQIIQLKQLHELIQKEESAIRNRKGKYAAPVERLKAERLLREIPGTVARLINKKKLLQEQNQGNSPKPGEIK